MSKFKSINKYSSEWDAHINKATASPQFAKQYKSHNFVLDSHKIAADKIKNHEAVGEQWIWGLCAAEMIDLGYVTEADLRPYRDAHLADIRRLKDYTLEAKDPKNKQTITFNPYEDKKAELIEKHRTALEIVAQKKVDSTANTQ